MGEGERVAGLEMRFDVLLVDLGLGLIGREDHDEVGFLSCGVHVAHLEARLLGLGPAARALAQAHAHVAARIEQVECMGVALASVPDDGDLHVLDHLGLAVRLIVNRYSHFLSPLNRG